MIRDFDEFGAQPLDRDGLQTIAVLQPLRDEVDDIGAMQFEGSPQDDGRGDAVDIVVKHGVIIGIAPVGSGEEGRVCRLLGARRQ